MKGYRKSRSPVYVTIVIVLATLCLAAVLGACGGPYNYGSATFADSQHGWVTGWDAAKKMTVLSRTTDGGVTWTRVGQRGTQSNAPVAGWAAFSTPSKGVWAVGMNTVLYTTTGGRPWRAATVRGPKGGLFSPDGYFSAASFASARIGWATLVKGNPAVAANAAGGWIAKTRNGGATWRIVKGTSRSGGFVDVACPTALRCYALKAGTLGGLWTTTDGGATWKRYVLPGHTGRYEAIDFPTKLTGWAVGADGMIAMTTDGGVTWTAQVSGVTSRLHGVHFTSVDSGFVGFAVGEKGVILYTQDAGSTWVQQASGTSDTLNTVELVSSAEGWAIGEAGWAPGGAGTLLHTTDAGQTWH
jgi:photosystem II stability/assembly factor-like uncharacterized protein